MNRITTLKNCIELARLSGLTSIPAPPSSPTQEQTTQETLKSIQMRVNTCTRCSLATTKKNYVFGEGHPQARIMFIGEAPGQDEDIQGRPFVGKAGQLLTAIIEKGMGLSRKDVYIANILKCRPPQSRDPLPEESDNCIEYLNAQIQCIHPEIIITMGRIASHILLNTTTPISRLRGHFHSIMNIPVMPTYHPAYLLRNPSSKKETWKDIQQVLRKIGLPIPG